MTLFVLRRLVGLIVVLLAMTAVIFLLRQVIPGDPARSALGPTARAEAVELKRAEMGLDRPLIEQYGRYMRQLVRGDLGESTRTRRAVTIDLGEFLPASAELMVFAVGLGSVIGIAFALLSTLWKSETVEALFASAASAPIFLTGLLLLVTFWFWLGVLPNGGRISGTPPVGPTGLYTLDGVLTGQLGITADALRHLLMPGLTLALPFAVAIGRTLRSSMIGVLRQPYIRTARAKGLPESSVLTRHVLRNSSTAPLTMGGLQIGMLFANILIVEAIFAWPGVGLYILQGLGRSDLPAVLGVSLVFGFAYVVINALVDLAQAIADPRIALN